MRIHALPTPSVNDGIVASHDLRGRVSLRLVEYRSYAINDYSVLPPVAADRINTPLKGTVQYSMRDLPTAREGGLIRSPFCFVPFNVGRLFSKYDVFCKSGGVCTPPLLIFRLILNSNGYIPAFSVKDIQVSTSVVPVRLDSDVKSQCPTSA